MGLRRKFRIAQEIFRRFPLYRGKVYAISVIMFHAVRTLYRATGIELSMPIRFHKRKFDELSEPVGLVNLWAIDVRLKPLNMKVCEDEPVRLNFILPSLNPRIIFGGYIAALNLMDRLADRGYRIRIIIHEEVNLNEQQVRDNCRKSRLADKVLQKVELYIAEDPEKEICVSKEDVYAGYSWITMRIAHDAARQTNDKLPIFFIQEFEPIFHHYDSFHALAVDTYELPHFAIFNSELLKRFFERKQLSVFSPTNPSSGLAYNHEYFIHAISDITLPSLELIANRKVKKLLYYARPEAHAGRNIFEVGLMALREALQKGVFDDSWEFYGIGSLALQEELELAEGVFMKMLPRVSLEKYCAMLSEYDVGVALMYAPHPSVPPFEMAAAGMSTVTTYFEGRTAEDTECISRNLIAVKPAPSSVAEGIRKAVERSNDYRSRVAWSKFDIPRTWEQSFNDALLDRLQAVLPE